MSAKLFLKRYCKNKLTCLKIKISDTQQILVSGWYKKICLVLGTKYNKLFKLTKGKKHYSMNSAIDLL